MTTPNWSALAVHFREQAARADIAERDLTRPDTDWLRAACPGCGVMTLSAMCAPCNRAVSEAVAARGEEVRSGT